MYKTFPEVAVVGARGAVGREVLRLLYDLGYPITRVTALGGYGSSGKTVKYGPNGDELSVCVLSETFNLGGIKYVIFCTGADVSTAWVPYVTEHGATVIDNSSAFRHQHGVPLVVPEINPGDLFARGNGRVIANPNCTTTIALMALWPLHLNFGLKTVVATSFQAVSGAGSAGLAELEDQLEFTRGGEGVNPRVFPRQIAHNVIPMIGNILGDGETNEERKFWAESRKIMGFHVFASSITCVRVPVRRAHTISINATFQQEVNMEIARQALMEMSGVRLLDHGDGGYPTPLEVEGEHDVFVGRLRHTNVTTPGRELSFVVSGDQILKGAALNTVQILEVLRRT